MYWRRLVPFLILGSSFAARLEADDFAGISGATLYHTYCAACHGSQGHGDGPVAPDLGVMVPDLTRLTSRHGGIFPADDVRRIIDGRTINVAHGVREMPVWGYRFGGSENAQGAVDATDPVSKLVAYLRSIQLR